jgi:hypothetical protein|tara:strand:- start:1455 stop:1616 length:162 start_codon:yes stop_codon:yes gene_type:complete
MRTCSGLGGVHGFQRFRTLIKSFAPSFRHRSTSFSGVLFCEKFDSDLLSFNES